MKHELKTDPLPFAAVLSGAKTFEIRAADRPFNRGDRLLLKETVSTGEEMKRGATLNYTGRSIEVSVTHIMRGPIYGLADAWVLMSVKPLKKKFTWLSWFAWMRNKTRPVSATRSAGSKKAWATRRAKVEMKRAD